MKFKPNSLKQYPKECGVYIMKDDRGEILYIGKAKKLRDRLKQYFIPGRDGRTMVPFLTAQIAAIETIVTLSEKEALLLENTLIKQHKPKYNILLKDDKTFISLMVNTKHKWPTLRLVRYKGRPKQDGTYFGPYTNAFAARQTLELIFELFPLRQCSDNELKSRKRPCLLYSIGRCLAPCVEKCTENEYRTNVTRVMEFLKGEDKEILGQLYKDMNEASDALRFEEAAEILRKIKQVQHVIENRKSLVHSFIKDCDVLGLYRKDDFAVLSKLIFREGRLIGSDHYTFEKTAAQNEEILQSFILQHYQSKNTIPREILLPFSIDAKLLEEVFQENFSKKIPLHIPKIGEKKSLIVMAEKNAKAVFQQELFHQSEKENLLLDLEEKLHLTRCPVRIECFDTAHISGSNAVACMIAYTNGVYDKKRTRLFRLKEDHQGDDYSALKEVLERRLIHAKEEDDLPDLVMLDGGKGHLNVGLEVFKELNIASVDIIAVAKEESKHQKTLTKEKVYMPYRKEPMALAPDSSLLFLVQKIRDEAHRVAIEFHRKKRKKSMRVSELDRLPGIGPKKKKMLLTHFGSIKNLKKASEEELKKIKGLNKTDIANLLEFIKK
ncbi:MAG: excinuclease ABC subunit UvrC [Simkaniaceae bacterium]